MPEQKGSKPDLGKLSDEEIKRLEQSLTSFIADIKSSGSIPEAVARIRFADAEHSSHVSA